MDTTASNQSPWAVPVAALAGGEESAFDRLWRGFMTARVGIAVVLTLLLGLMLTIGPQTNVNEWLVGLCVTYLAAATAVRMLSQPMQAGPLFDPQWVSTIGVDLLAFATLQFLQAGGLNYSPLFTLPVLTAAVLGSALLALGTAAAVTLLLLVDTWVIALQHPADYSQRFLQAGLTGLGFFVVAVLANQLASRLAREERKARSSVVAALMQSQVNELVIETLSEGVLVVDQRSAVLAANPAASALLGWDMKRTPPPQVLGIDPSCAPLLALARLTFEQRAPQDADLALPLPAGERRLVHVRTRLTPPQQPQAVGVCVMFLQDLREMEARLRTEKLAAMGRMSTAVAHEIRNPLAAIAQANELLAEELAEPVQKQLSELVRQNAQRLARIVEEILDIARVQQQRPEAEWLVLDESVCTVCDEWAEHAHASDRVRQELGAGIAAVDFEGDHLRRVLVNLLDNALRYAGRSSDSIVVSTRVGENGQPQLVVFSDGEPIDAGVQQHLFEPFFSSESRSSGLGLYICRELCSRHGATLGYRRVSATGGAVREGNEFFVNFRAHAAVAPAVRFDTIPG
ncbi:two-component system sensor histidine kinase NtrB [Ramlibacter albus]|uniref:histidine kinase n=1 Tax=Ramlibacter albus TaxID=2079448 RepID=A0A923S0G0_9BURK|nr:ATP-binding protein [Ramlibacter albus]MBC5763220.1 PAS domain-containing protein [Ramlibacter albus]